MYHLFRTNPWLTGNVKITVSDDGLYLTTFSDDQINVSPKRISLKKGYQRDVVDIFKNMTTDEIFKPVKTKEDVVLSSLKDQYQTRYLSTVKFNKYKSLNKRYSILAPLYLNDTSLPEKFIIFRRKNNEKWLRSEVISGEQYVCKGMVKFNGNIYNDGDTFTASIDGIVDGEVYPINPNILHGDKGDILLELKDMEIVKIFNIDGELKEYISSDFREPNFTLDSVYINHTLNEIYYNGFSIKDGSQVTAVESLRQLTDKELDIFETDQYVTQGFYRNEIISNNIINIEWLFDDDVEGDNTYFGFYVNDVDFASFDIDRHKMFGKNGRYPMRSNDYEIIPKSDDGIIKDNDIKIDYIKETESNFLPSNLNGLSLPYVKTMGNYFKVKDIDNDKITLNIDEVPRRDIDFLDNERNVSVKKPDNTIGSVAILQINDETYNGLSIKLFENGRYFKEIYCDDLLDVTQQELLKIKNDFNGDINKGYTDGDSIGYYFHPSADKRKSAESIAKALKWIFKGMPVNIGCFDNKVVIQSLSGGNEYELVIDNTDVFTILDNFNKPVDTISSMVIVNAEENINVGDYILCYQGYTKVIDITSYILEPLYDNGELIDYKDFDKYKIISVGNNYDISISDSSISVYSLNKLTFGSFGVVNIADFDYDMLYSDYLGKNVEISKYYGLKDGMILQKDEYFIMLKDDLSQTIPSAYENGVSIPYFVDHEVTNVISQNNIVVVGDVSDFTTHIFHDGLIYEISNISQAGTGMVSITTSDPIPNINVSDNIRPVHSGSGYELKIGDGNPIITKLYYYLDEEIKEFEGFGIVLQDEDINNSVDYSKLQNKKLLFDGVNNEYVQKEYFRYPLQNRMVCETVKWVGGEDVNNVGYRLNYSKVFPLTNFSPSLKDTKPSPKMFTHEWFYVCNVPYDEQLITEDYFEYFDENKFFDDISYFDNFINSKNLIRRKLFAESTKKIVDILFNNMQNGYLMVQINDDLYIEPFYVDTQSTLQRFINNNSFDILNNNNVIVTYYSLNTLRFESKYPGEYFKVDIAESCNGTFIKTQIQDNDGYDVVTKNKMSHPSIIKKEYDNIFTTFFKGLKYSFSTKEDISSFKFVALLNVSSSKKLDKLFDQRLLINKDSKAIVLLTTIALDDYKCLVDSDGDNDYDYIDGYILGSMKRFENGIIKYGYDVEIPTLPSYNYVDSNLSPNNILTAVKTDLMLLTANNNDITFNSKSSIFVEDIINPIKSGDYGRILGVDGLSSFITSENPFSPPNNIIIDKPTTITSVSADTVYLKNNGLSILGIANLSAAGSYNPYSVNTLIYPLNNVIWYYEDGGYNFYRATMKMLSSGYLKDNINNINIVGDISDLKANVVDTNVIAINESIKIDVDYKDLGSLGTVKIYNKKYDNTPYFVERYDMAYNPKLKTLIEFDDYNFLYPIGHQNIKIKNAKYMMSDPDINKTLNEYPKITTKFYGKNITIKSFKDVIIYGHKNNNVVMSDEKIYPEIGEVAYFRNYLKWYLPKRIYPNYLWFNSNSDKLQVFDWYDGSINNHFMSDYYNLKDNITYDTSMITSINVSEIDNKYSIEYNENEIITDILKLEMSDYLNNLINPYLIHADKTEQSIKDDIVSQYADNYSLDVMVFTKPGTGDLFTGNLNDAISKGFNRIIDVKKNINGNNTVLEIIKTGTGNDIFLLFILK